MIAALTAGAAVCSFGAAYLTHQMLPVRPLQLSSSGELPTDGVASLPISVGGVQTDLPPPLVKPRTVRGGKVT